MLNTTNGPLLAHEQMHVERMNFGVATLTPKILADLGKEFDGFTYRTKAKAEAAVKNVWEEARVSIWMGAGGTRGLSYYADHAEDNHNIPGAPRAPGIAELPEVAPGVPGPAVPGILPLPGDNIWPNYTPDAI